MSASAVSILVFGIYIIVVGSGFVLFVVTKKAQPMLIAFGVIDAAFGLWTLLTLY